MTPDQLRKTGEALYGEGFKHKMAKDLDVSTRTVERWLAGTVPIPAHVREELADVCYGKIIGLDDQTRQRRDALHDLLGRLEVGG